jgi:hypothetical protein
VGLRQLLDETGDTQTALATAVERSDAMISRLVSGEAKPSFDTAADIVRYFSAKLGRRVTHEEAFGDPLAQDDSAADRPTSGIEGEPRAANADSGSPVCASPCLPRCADAGGLGAQGHTQPSAPTGAHTSGGLAPDTSADPSAVDVPVAPLTEG